MNQLLLQALAASEIRNSALSSNAKYLSINPSNYVICIQLHLRLGHSSFVHCLRAWLVTTRSAANGATTSDLRDDGHYRRLCITGRQTRYQPCWQHTPFQQPASCQRAHHPSHQRCRPLSQGLTPAHNGLDICRFPSNGVLPEAAIPLPSSLQEPTATD